MVTRESWENWDVELMMSCVLERVKRDGNKLRVDGRKLRLFACAVVRRHWGRVDSANVRAALEKAEAYADGEAELHELRVSVDPVTGGTWSLVACWATQPSGWSAAVDTAKEAYLAAAKDAPAGVSWTDARDAERYAQAELFRDIFEPFREPLRMVPGWLTPAILSLASAAYAERLPDGRLDPARLAVLSDALEEGGCNDERLLAHLRSPRPHYRGMWGLDWLMGNDG